MSLLDVRKKFIEISGRVDLVSDTTDYNDAGADYYIQEGQNELDRERLQHFNSDAINFYPLYEGEYVARISMARAISSVYWLDSDSHTKLEHRYYDELREEYNSSFRSVDSGNPIYWTPVNLRHAPSFDRIESTNFDTISSYVDLVGLNYHKYNGIIVAPPPDQDINLEIHGLFYSDELVNNGDENFWTLSEPSILVYAALRELERGYRNMTGVNEWTTHIQQKLTGLDMDVVEGQIASTSVMRG